MRALLYGFCAASTLAPDAAISILENAIARSRLHTDPVGVSLLEAFCELLYRGFQTYWQEPISRKPKLIQLGLL